MSKLFLISTGSETSRCKTIDKMVQNDFNNFRCLKLFTLTSSILSYFDTKVREKRKLEEQPILSQWVTRDLFKLTSQINPTDFSFTQCTISETLLACFQLNNIRKLGEQVVISS